MQSACWKTRQFPPILRKLTSRAISWPTRPAAFWIAVPFSSSPRPLTCVCAEILWVLAVLFTSSIFIVTALFWKKRDQRRRARCYSYVCFVGYTSPPSGRCYSNAISGNWWKSNARYIPEE